MGRRKEKARPERLKARILVVDDEPELVETIRDILVFKGFDVETAENGAEAIDRLKSAHHFDLMITDLRMPEMDGSELLKAVREIKKGLPIIILTGHATVENGVDLLEQGACDYLLKPFNLDQLMSAVIRSVSGSRPDLMASL
jgi:two-component system response regulator AtoC